METLIKEFVLSKDEIKQKYPIGKTVIIDGGKYIVKGYQQPQATINFASYPRVVFELAK